MFRLPWLFTVNFKVPGRTAETKQHKKSFQMSTNLNYFAFPSSELWPFTVWLFQKWKKMKISFNTALNELNWKTTVDIPVSVFFNLVNIHSVSWYLFPCAFRSKNEHFKEIASLEQFKNEIKKWCLANCPCKLCLQYIKGLGYVN